MGDLILVVDDEVDILNLIARNLKSEGFEVITAKDGVKAINKAEGEMPDLMILDLILPGISGLDVCRALKNNPRTAGIPIIILSAKAEEIDRIVGLQLGVDDYIAKPFSTKELALRVQSVLRRVKDWKNYNTINPSEGNTSKNTTITAGKIKIDVNLCKVNLNNKFILLKGCPSECGRHNM